MVEVPPNSRFKLWMFGVTFNVIVLIAVASLEQYTEARAWGITLSVISLVISTSTVICHLHPLYRGIILNTKYELYLILATLTLWTILVAIVTSPTSGLAVEDDGAVKLGNMYYFTWGGFVTSVISLASYTEMNFGISIRSSFQSNNNSNNENMKTPSMAFIYWTALMASSIVVMGTSADIYNRSCEMDVNLKPQPFCSRTVFAISTGTISTIACLIIIAPKLLYMNIPFIFEVTLSMILFILYTFELYYATGTDGPGSPLGNLYYFSWISFMLCLGVGKCCYEDYIYVVEMAENEFEDGRIRRLDHIPSLDEGDYDTSGSGSAEGGDVGGAIELGNGGAGAGGSSSIGQTTTSKQYESVSSTSSPTSNNAGDESSGTTDFEIGDEETLKKSNKTADTDV